MVITIFTLQFRSGRLTLYKYSWYIISRHSVCVHAGGMKFSQVHPVLLPSQCALEGSKQTPHVPCLMPIELESTHPLPVLRHLLRACQ